MSRCAVSCGDFVSFAYFVVVSVNDVKHIGSDGSFCVTPGHKAHALRDHPHVEPEVSLQSKYSKQKEFREMLQMPGESFLQERIVISSSRYSSWAWHFL